MNTEELSEEDQQLKNELEMLVERILVRRLILDACVSVVPGACSDRGFTA
jgi:hypothetical protein